MNRIYISAACLAAAVVAQAQNLSTEVVVDRTVSPVERAATRLSGLSPQLMLPTPATPALAGADYRLLSPVTRSYTNLTPAEGSGLEPRSNHRGYASLGYLPWQNIGFSAGYRFADSEKLTVDGYATFDRASYYSSQEIASYINRKQGYTNMLGALDLSWRPDTDSELKSRVSLDVLRQGSVAWDPQYVKTLGADLGWQSKAGDLEYYANLGTQIERSNNVSSWYVDYKPDDYNRNDDPRWGGHSQDLYNAALGAAANFAGSSYAGIDLATSILNSKALDGGTPDKSYYMATITPYYALRADSLGGLGARVGLGCELENSDGDTHFHVLPDLRLQWRPGRMMGLWVTVGGGTEFNTFADMRRYSPIALFKTVMEPSYIPVKIESGINIGPCYGIGLGLYGGYAKAQNWQLAASNPLMPYEAVGQLKSYYGGVSLDATVSVVKAHVSAEFAPSGRDYAWIYNRDRASCVLNASLDADISQKLTAGVAYDRRTGRKAYGVSNEYAHKLGDVNNLSFHAEYRLEPTYTVWCHIENVLSKHWEMIYMQDNQGIHGLIGVSVKF